MKPIKVTVIHANKGENADNGRQIMATKMKAWYPNAMVLKDKTQLKTKYWFVFNAKFKLYKTNLRLNYSMNLQNEYTIMKTLKSGQIRIITLEI